MSLHAKAGKKVSKNDLINVNEIINSYYMLSPDPHNPNQKVSFGTSGHRGNSTRKSFNEQHIIAITQAICDFRKKNNISGPLFIGKDTHALSSAAEKTAIEVLAANNVETFMACDNGFTPTPVISHSIITYNKNNHKIADGIVITPSHNPPEDGGIKYNESHGGPANTDSTNWIAKRANELIINNHDVNQLTYSEALSTPCIKSHDFVTSYVSDLKNVIDIEAIKNAELKICVDALGGSAMKYWHAINQFYNLNLVIKNDVYDPTFSFMHADHDGKIRMDCSSQYAMASLINLKNDFDVIMANDPDADRHGIVTPSTGLLNPNHFLASCIHFLFNNRKDWDRDLAVGKTLVSSSIIDRIVNELNKDLKEVPVGFKWFVQDLLNGNIGFGGEESAGASFLRKNGEVWTTDKDGIILSLLACEIKAKTKIDAGEYYNRLTLKHGSPVYSRLDADADMDEKQKISTLSPDDLKTNSLADEEIITKMTHASGNNKPIGGIKITTKNGWFAARPSGTEDIYKIYVESFLGESHLKKIQQDAKKIVADAIT